MQISGYIEKQKYTHALSRAPHEFGTNVCRLDCINAGRSAECVAAVLPPPPVHRQLTSNMANYNGLPPACHLISKI
jgi:hypothetical protein